MTTATATTTTMTKDEAYRILAGLYFYLLTRTSYLKLYRREELIKHFSAMFPEDSNQEATYYKAIDTILNELK